MKLPKSFRIWAMEGAVISFTPNSSRMKSSEASSSSFSETSSWAGSNTVAAPIAAIAARKWREIIRQDSLPHFGDKAKNLSPTAELKILARW
jgi:hypothetical protein